MSLDYPSTLPNPVKAGHTPKARVSATDLPGPGTYESRERDYSGTMAVEFFLTAEQAAEFYIWWRDDLIEGGRWFNCTWPSLRPGPMVVQFLQEPVFNHVYGGATRVSGVVQVRGASLPVFACVFDPYYRQLSDVVFEEDFSDGLVNYTAVSGLASLFSVVPDVYGQTLLCSGDQPAGVTTHVISRAVASTKIDLLTFYFQIVSDDTDDAAQVSMLGHSFNPRREAAFDIDRKPQLSLLGFSSALAVGTWYFAELYYSGSEMLLRLTNQTTSAVSTHVPAIPGSVISPLTALTFTIDASGLANSMCPTKYANFLGYSYRARTALSLHGETLLDSSALPKTVTAVGAVTVSTAKMPYGNASLYFNGSGGRLRVTNHADLNFRNEDFTIRFKFLLDVTGVGYTLLGKRTGTNFGAVSIIYLSGAIVARLDDDRGTGSWLGTLTGSQTILADTWYDYELTRVGGVFSHRLDGVLKDSFTAGSSTVALDAEDVDLYIGANSDGTSGLNGYIKDLLIIKGAALHTADFTPPVFSTCDR